MAKVKQDNSGLSGKKVTVHEIYDGDKYKEDIFVGLNGKNYVIKRGVDVEVPEEVAEILRRSHEQDTKTMRMIAALNGKQVEIPYT